MNYVHVAWPLVKEFLSAAYVAALITLASIYISWQQLSYAKKRDAALDLRNTWETIHKAMLEFRLRRDVLVDPGSYGHKGVTPEIAVNAMEALNRLVGEIDRAPESPFATELWMFLKPNLTSAQWRAPEFQEQFDKYSRRVAVKVRGDAS